MNPNPHPIPPAVQAPAFTAPGAAPADGETATALQPSTGPLTLVLGGGCFWCTEAAYLRVKGVLAVEPGYANGDAQRWPKPTYEQVCSGATGYNEVVRLRYDPSLVSTQDVLDVFFAIHDPTTLNRQGNDVGTQYRSGVYFTVPEQGVLAQRMVDDWNAEATWGAPVVTEVQPLLAYTTAEAYHHNYFDQHPHQGYCAMVVAPKVLKLEATFQRLLR